MIKRYNELQDALIKVSKSSDHDIQVDDRPVFKNRAAKIEKQLSEINICTLAF